MYRALALLVALCTAAPGGAASIDAFELAPDGSTLTIGLSDGRRRQAPLSAAGQEGFSNVQVSPDRRRIGWTVTFPNCCTSYPLPLALVIHDGEHVLRVIPYGDGPAIFSWYFSPESRSIIYARELPHGLTPTRFFLLRITDGRLLRQFECVPDTAEQPAARRRHPPAWTRRTQLDCLPDTGERRK